MALNIKTAADPVEIGALITLIYGQPGIGKTSLAFTAAAPLLLDFDAGAHRSGYRKDYVPVKAWGEVAAIKPDDLKGYKTVIVDTLGACLDRLAEDILRRDPKMLNRYTGGLSLQGFGALKLQFGNWVKALKQSGLDVVLIAHGKEKTENDNTFIRPDIIGGSYDEVMKMADFCGYYYMNREEGHAARVLDFSPTERWIGKNSAGFPPLAVPNLAEAPDYLGHKLAEARERLASQSEAQKQAVDLINTWKAMIDTAPDAAAINKLVTNAKESLNESHGVTKQIKALIARRAKEMGLAFQGGQYINAADEEIPE